MQDTSQLEKRLSFAFQNKDLLTQALTHRSYLNENPAFRTGHNERLEFLGDAVLELVITEALYARFPNKPEGELTSFRAALVNAKMLADVGLAIGINDFMLLSRGEAKDTGRARQFILANAFEALVGAMYLDQGYTPVRDFILAVLLPHLDGIVEHRLYKDPKSLFQEEAQEREGVTPTYEVQREWGPDHDRHFVIGVFLGDELVAEGEGPSKQTAQEEAAKAALAAKGWG
ncbi:MAG: ribonuclease III [Candidatus Sungbacteria bacterium RIFCSPLOWO2_02_FULL_54_10]|uniref:Ribonuclease 3 n=2 Tax=Candidatus Sungiibacteriota TaxID=1817917 RepID=A0A1G2L699_9BACT|nr:MAG: ribonuclease III [Candidatus Sungbacteria bacterium RIFCSPHIGHO2_01_FULL_54_26]OHA03283.1 MAG: ribonuclease III [Candidatus Sungbacteria bacterium RIFCSPHIGHO2_02_FULL_53_17]OHA07100.1 MAG: ribonuclease III [Candidatus Sungbacteria bacterium RIFCSPLOWO2_01_FULL_54_21]OHA12804.1 MAG: ribonuclease III [Candidatus Sungbacteria bacterium RIFCSPLOWO2_02_FULL_54_10]